MSNVLFCFFPYCFRKMTGWGTSKLNLNKITIGNLQDFSHKSRKGSKITVNVKRQSKQRSNQSTLADWSRDEVAAVLENVPVDINVDDFIADTGRTTSTHRRKRRRRKMKISYREKRRRVLQSWRDHRDKIKQTYIAGEVLPDDTSCCGPQCDQEATHRCLECRVDMYFCSTHVHEAHQECLHVPEIWQVSATSIRNSEVRSFTLNLC